MMYISNSIYMRWMVKDNKINCFVVFVFCSIILLSKVDSLLATYLELYTALGGISIGLHKQHFLW
jgi:hypothetical protein